MTTLALSARSIGYLAHQSLLNETTATVLGAISKGLYLLTPGQRVIYISYETYRSPLTMTLVETPPELPSIEPGETVKLSPTSLIWLDGKLRLSLATAEIWSAPIPRITHEIQDTPDRRIQRLVEIAAKVSAAKGQLGFAPLLLPILGLEQNESLPAELEPVWAKLKGILQSGPNLTPTALIELLSGLLGYGRGLTPSGDDLLTGFLLALARWNYPSAELGQELSRAAYQKTTTLSANLIECAAAGGADERLIQVVDAVAAGNAPLQPCVDSLVGYGNSSGADVLAGIALAARMWTARPGP
jgi:Protein of unknown function (DUF2877).